MAEAGWSGEVKILGGASGDGRVCRGTPEILGVIEGAKEDKESWLGFLRQLKQRGLEGIRLVISDKCLGLIEAIAKAIRRHRGRGASCIDVAMCVYGGAAWPSYLIASGGKGRFAVRDILPAPRKERRLGISQFLGDP